jgi:hypothetical protein
MIFDEAQTTSRPGRPRPGIEPGTPSSSLTGSLSRLRGTKERSANVGGWSSRMSPPSRAPLGRSTSLSASGARARTCLGGTATAWFAELRVADSVHRQAGRARADSPAHAAVGLHHGGPRHRCAAPRRPTRRPARGTPHDDDLVPASRKFRWPRRLGRHGRRTRRSVPSTAAANPQQLVEVAARMPCCASPYQWFGRTPRRNQPGLEASPTPRCRDRDQGGPRRVLWSGDRTNRSGWCLTPMPDPVGQRHDL